MTIVTPGVLPASLLNATPPGDWLGRFATFAARLRPGAIPAEVMHRAKLVLLDSLGVIAAGLREPEVAALAQRLVMREGQGPTPLLATAHHTTPGTAALLHGIAGTTLELDEGNQYCRGHPAIHVVPALLATAGRAQASGAEFLAALCLGYELGARTGMATALRVTMHPHGTWGTLGAALGVARLHGATSGKLAATINIASSLGLATSRRTMLEGATVRNAYAGVSNQLGLLARDLAEAGFGGERDGVATVFGSIAGTEFDATAMTEQLGTRWEIARNYFKRHAACRYTHGALDALGALLRQHGPLAPDDIAAIDVATYVWAAQLDDPAPATMLAAKFSLPFALASFVAHGTAGIDAFRDAARANPAVQSLAARVRVAEDAALTARLPGLRPARVTLTLRDGTSRKAEALTNKGDTEDPYSEAEILEKFHELADPVWGVSHATRLRNTVLTLDDAHGTQALEALLPA